MSSNEVEDHHARAVEELRKCDEALEECRIILDSLERTLKNSPKPSECLDWSTFPW